MVIGEKKKKNHVWIEKILFIKKSHIVKKKKNTRGGWKAISSKLLPKINTVIIKVNTDFGKPVRLRPLQPPLLSNALS